MHTVSNSRDLRVIMLVQKIDEADWLVGFTVGWIRALAAHVKSLDVVALEAQPTLLPANIHVHSLGKERRVGRIRELLAFERILSDLSRQADVIFGHLTPRYTWLAAPWAATHRVPQCLWYTHRQIDLELRLAARSARWIATAAPGSFPLPGPKVHVLGHGIDAQRFSPGDVQPDADSPLILAVGRVAPIKRHDILIEAAALLRDRNLPARFAIAGGATSAEGQSYQAKLQARITELGLSDRVTLLGAQRGDDLIGLYRRASIVTNLSAVGLFDKAALEAMCCARPTLVTNPAFDDMLADRRSLLYLADPPDPQALADRLGVILALPAAERDSIGRDLRERTVHAHSLDGLMDRLVNLWLS